MNHTQQAIDAMQNALDHARVADSARHRGMLRAAQFAVFLPEVIADSKAKGDDDHAAWCEARLADLREWLRPSWDALVPPTVSGYSIGPTREAVWEDIERALVNTVGDRAEPIT